MRVAWPHFSIYSLVKLQDVAQLIVFGLCVVHLPSTDVSGHTISTVTCQFYGKFCINLHMCNCTHCWATLAFVNILSLRQDT